MAEHEPAPASRSCPSACSGAAGQLTPSRSAVAPSAANQARSAGRFGALARGRFAPAPTVSRTTSTLLLLCLRARESWLTEVRHRRQSSASTLQRSSRCRASPSGCWWAGSGRDPVANRDGHAPSYAQVTRHRGDCRRRVMSPSSPPAKAGRAVLTQSATRSRQCVTQLRKPVVSLTSGGESLVEVHGQKAGL